MPKSTAKGNKFELEAKKTLEFLGWEVFRQHRKPMFINKRMITVGADAFGCDLIAKRKNIKALWIQVSTVDNLSGKKAQILEHVVNPIWETYQVWCRMAGKRAFRVFELNEDLTWTEKPTQDVQIGL